MVYPHVQQAGAAQSASQRDPEPKLLWLHDCFWHPERRCTGSGLQMPKPAPVLKEPLHPGHTRLVYMPQGKIPSAEVVHHCIRLFSNKM